MTAPPDAQAAADRLERLLKQLRNGADPRAAVIAEEMIRCLVQLYGAGLARIVEIIGPRHSHGLCADPLVESLMLVHDLHPLGPDARIRRALGRAGLDPGDLRYDGIDAHGVAHVRLTGNGHGCRSSVRRAVESAIQAAAPEVAGVVVEFGPAPEPLLQISRRPGPGAAR